MLIENMISSGRVKNFQNLDSKNLALDPKKVRHPILYNMTYYAYAHCGFSTATGLRPRGQVPRMLDVHEVELRELGPPLLVFNFPRSLTIWGLNS